MEELLSTLKVHELELREDEGKRKEKKLPSKHCPMHSKLRNHLMKFLEKKTLMKMNCHSSLEKYTLCGGRKTNQYGGNTPRRLPKTTKARHKLFKPRYFKSKCPTLEKEEKKKKIPIFKKKKILLTTWEDLDLSSIKEEGEEKEANHRLMANIELESKEEDEFAYQELLSNSSTFSVGYKDLKRRFSKLPKDFKFLQKENVSLRKENKNLKEKQIPSSISSTNHKGSM
ncbi:hypothetical protein CR513_22271, partial [Mucuna pruriens]